MINPSSEHKSARKTETIPDQTTRKRMKTAPLTRHKLTLFADYHQFYIQDEAADGDLSESWTPDTEISLVAVAPGTIGVGTARDADVPVSIELSDAEPESDFSLFDQVVDCSISIQSGTLVAAGCTDYFPEAARFQVAPGTYRVRVYFSGLDTISADGMDGDDNYRLVLWPGGQTAPTVLKQRGN